MRLKEIEGTYGAGNTPCTVFVAELNRTSWYTCEGSVNVNATFEPLEDGVDVEIVEDVDCFTWNEPIGSVDELERAVSA